MVAMVNDILMIVRGEAEKGSMFHDISFHIEESCDDQSSMVGKSVINNSSINAS